MSRAIFGSLPWRSRSQHDLVAKSCPVHNFVIWSQIWKQFHRNDHHTETTCRLHLGCFLEGKGHSMTFQQNSFRPITLWFEVECYKYFTEMITILRQRVVCNIWVATLKAKVTACMTLQQNRVWPKTLLFEVGFYNYFWQTTSLCQIPIRGALPGSDRLLF